MKRLIRDENGQVMVLVLILLIVGGLIIAPLLSYMGTGLLTGRVYERRTAELYAADAGVEDAVWKIQHPGEAGYLPCSLSSPPRAYNITDVNGKKVEVTITYTYGDEQGVAYLVESTATGDGSGTQIDAYITGTIVSANYSGIMDQIATSQGETDIAKKVTLIYPEGCGPYPNYPGAWPPANIVADFYWQDVEGLTPYGSGTIDINGVNMDLGPLYRDGTMEILNSSNTPATLTLTGTIYITGDTLIGQNGKDNLTLELNGQTIFVESDTAGNQKALILGGKCTIHGPGVIIAVGDIEFKPKEQAGVEPIFVLSVSGTTTMQPSGNYYGAIAGSVEVEIQAGTKPTITYPEGGLGGLGLNFPTLFEIERLYSIASWEVSQQ
ncbi:MAG: pilus assembly protein PilZ [Dehalococcoidia bacterium]|nr:pilus assembly protein PilZ [Dehalococcoidia bacterium]